MADNYGSAPVQGPDYERLGAFVGKWHAEGQSYGRNQDRNDPRAAAEPWVSDEITEWHPGKFFVIQREDAKTGSASLITYGVMGYDADSGDYVAHAFENYGHCRRYVVSVERRIWTFTGVTGRARVEFSEDGNTSNGCRFATAPISESVSRFGAMFGVERPDRMLLDVTRYSGLLPTLRSPLQHARGRPLSSLPFGNIHRPRFLVVTSKICVSPSGELRYGGAAYCRSISTFHVPVFVKS